MELSPEGMAAAAAVREAAKKRSQDAAVKQEKQEPQENGPAAGPVKSEPDAKRQQGPGGRPPPTCSHEVAVPEGFDEASITLDPAVHGGHRGACVRLCAPGVCRGHLARGGGAKVWGGCLSGRLGGRERCCRSVTPTRPAAVRNGHGVSRSNGGPCSSELCPLPRCSHGRPPGPLACDGGVVRRGPEALRGTATHGAAWSRHLKTPRARAVGRKGGGAFLAPRRRRRGGWGHAGLQGSKGLRTGVAVLTRCSGSCGSPRARTVSLAHASRPEPAAPHVPPAADRATGKQLEVP